MDITGILKRKSETNTVSEKFKKREFVLTDNSSQYPQHISFQLTQDKCNLIDDVKVGDELKVHFNLRGREWTSPKGEIQYFNTLEAWRLEKMASGSGAAGAAASTDAQTTVASGAGQEDDLPF